MSRAWAMSDQKGVGMAESGRVREGERERAERKGHRENKTKPGLLGGSQRWPALRGAAGNDAIKSERR